VRAQGISGGHLARSRHRGRAARLAGIAVLLTWWGCGRASERLLLATTSSAHDSGLLTEVARLWNAEEAPPMLHVVVAGSGEALALGRRGDADVLLVHAPDAERQFMDDGHGVLQLLVMTNDLLLVGPAADPADVEAAVDVLDAMRRIDAIGTFVSRGDDSGTHQRERALRRAAGLEAPLPGGRYLDTGEGMAATLRVASERQAYTLTDRATWEVLRGGLQLIPLPAAHPLLDNPYSVIVPRRAADTASAARFARWLRGPRGQAAIRAFAAADGRPLFTPADDMPADADPPRQPAARR
jgi:tungstate transport system substrate-binding protein